MEKVIFTSSAGGHFAELLQLEELMSKFDSLIVTEKVKSSSSSKHKTKYLIYGSRNSNKLVYLFTFLINTLKSLWIYISFRPKYIVSTGVHSTVPIMIIAKLFGKKVIYIETIANVTSPTLTGKIIYKYTDLFLVQWEELLEVYPEAVYGGSIFK